MVHRGRRSKRARILRALKQAWREHGKPEEYHIVDFRTGEINLKNDISELDLSAGTVLRLGAYRLDVEDIIEQRYTTKCNELGLNQPSRMEMLSFTINSMCTSLIPQFIYSN